MKTQSFVNSKLFLLLFFSCSIQSIFAQFSVQPVQSPASPTSVIEEVLLGKGVEVINVTYSGNENQVGTFQNGANIFGIQTGLVLSTGFVSDIEDTEDAEASEEINLSSETTIDPDINALRNGSQPIHDPVTYIIDFVPSSDLVEFKYVFASEEYPEFSCSNFSDFFGFFVSGPGINGPYENAAENIALVEGTNQVVSIETVHPNYIDGANGPALGLPDNCGDANIGLYNSSLGSTDEFVFDGYLNVMTASIGVVPCSQYRLKIVLTDQGDGIRDSGVFLEANSLSSEGSDLVIVTPNDDGVLVEGCVDGSVEVRISKALSTDTDINYSVLTGVNFAENGTDFQDIGTQVTIPAGSLSNTIDIVTIGDSDVESEEIIGISFQISSCLYDTAYFILRDSILEAPDLGLDESICEGESLFLDAQISTPRGGIDTFEVIPTGTFSANTTAVISVAGINNKYLNSKSIDQICVDLIYQPNTNQTEVYLTSPSNIKIPLSINNNNVFTNSNSKICFSPDASGTIQDTYSGVGEGPYLPDGNVSELWTGVPKPIEGDWLIEVNNSSGVGNGQLKEVLFVLKDEYDYSHVWSPAIGLTSPATDTTTAKPISDITYTVDITDIYGCGVDAEKSIDIQDSLEAPVVNCSGVSNDEITFAWTAISGITDYEINVDNAGWVKPNGTTGLTHEITGLSQGETVNIQARGVGGSCGSKIGTQSCTTIDCTGKEITVTNKQDPSCPNNTDGSFTVSYSSTDGPINYFLGTETNITGIFSSLGAGSHSVLARDASGCGKTLVVVLSDPTQIETSISINQQIDCNNTTGTVTVSASGGAGNYSYIWSNGSTIVEADNLSADTEYEVRVTDANGCFALDTIELTTVASISATLNDIEICPGTNDGELIVENLSNTVGNVNYTWAGQTETSSTLSNLGAGSYSVTISDDSGCDLVLNAQVNSSSLAATTTFTQDDCGVVGIGTATVTPTGGTSPYSYAWSDANSQTLATATGLSQGNYKVTVTDANNCSIEESVDITQINGVTIIDATIVGESCLNANDASATINISGGTAPFVYNWNNSSVSSTGPTAANLEPNTYNVEVVDASGCADNLEVVVEPNNGIQISANIIPVGCTGTTDGSIDITITADNPIANINWDNGMTTEDISNLSAGDYSVTLIDNTGCQKDTSFTVGQTSGFNAILSDGITCFNASTATLEVTNLNGAVEPITYTWTGTSSTSNSATNLGVGTYSVVVMDNAGCQNTLSANVISNGSINTSVNAVPDDCRTINVGQAIVVPSGGTAPYTYLWDDSNAQTTNAATGLSAGSYAVTVTDNIGCTAQSSVVVGSPSGIGISNIQINSNDCHGDLNGEISFDVIGGTAPIDISWDDASLPATNTLSNLASGIYEVTVRDVNFCESSRRFTIDSPDSIEILGTATNLLCFENSDATITPVVTGGNPGGYTYLWDDGVTTINRTGLSRGNYNLIVTDVLNCRETKSFEVTAPEILSLSMNSEKADCFYNHNGQVSGTAQGGTQPYTYTWSNGIINQNLIENLSPDEYKLTVTDANNCIVSDSLVLESPDTLRADFEVDEVTCFDGSDGEIRIFANGGEGQLLYSLDVSPFSTASVYPQLERGFYNVGVKDENNCIIDTLLYASAPDPIVVDLGNDTTLVLGDSLLLNANISGNIGGVQYLWSNTEAPALNCIDCFNPVVSPLDRVDVSLTVTDDAGCVGNDLKTIYVDLDYTITAPNVFSPSQALNLDNRGFTLYGKEGVRVNVLNIFDRWGDKVFENSDFWVNDISNGWFGDYKKDLLQPAVFVWQAEVLFPNGVTKIVSGDVLLLK